MDVLKVTELVQDNISKSELKELADTYFLPEEGVIITLHNKGLITDSQYEEIVNTSELMLAVHTELVIINNSTGYLTIVEVTDNDGWILEFKPYVTNVLSPNNEHHAEVCKLMETALAEGNKVTISRDPVTK